MSTDDQATRAEVCVTACADLFAEDGEILASPMGLVPGIGARLARRTSAPDLVLSDGEAYLLDDDGVLEGWLPYRRVFDVVAHGSRHVVMGASQVDRYGNQNISCIGEHSHPKRQLLGVRGAPGNTVNHRTSYWVPKHSPRVFVDRVDVASGVGYDRARDAGPGAQRFHDIHRVVTNLAVLDFETGDRSMRLRSVHPGVTVTDVEEATGFALTHDDEVPQTRVPGAEELRLLREAVDPSGRRDREVPA
ncbi:MAG: CoA-transferase [Actinomycetota bacterium]|nr:CoA-transferase [Actinomycetota bacterium]